MERPPVLTDHGWLRPLPEETDAAVHRRAAELFARGEASAFVPLVMGRARPPAHAR